MGFLLLNFTIHGLMSVARELSFPFGTDMYDLPVYSYCVHTASTSLNVVGECFEEEMRLVDDEAHMHADSPHKAMRPGNVAEFEGMRKFSLIS